MEEKRLPFIYRIHEPPGREATEEFRRFISHIGYKMGKESDHSPMEFQKILAAVKGKPEEKVVNNNHLRSMKWAKYASVNRGHFGLASDAYTHFTSPIRRYPDLIVHRLLKRALTGREIKVTTEDLAKKADHLSRRERVAMEAEREIVDRYRIRFMRERIGDVFDGVVSGVTAFGFFVELTDIFVEGLVRVTGLHDDYYQYHEKRYCLEGERTHRTFRIGDNVRVRLERVDVDRRHLDFGLAVK
jgi:ribonuclease R